MQKWMLLEPDGTTVMTAGSHQTRTGCNYRLNTRGSRGIGEMLGTLDPNHEAGTNLAADDERQVMKILLQSAETVEERHASWHNLDNHVESARKRSEREGYNPVSTLTRLEAYTPPLSEIDQVKQGLPCLDRTQKGEWSTDDRGNQFGFFRHSNYYAAFCFGTRKTTAQYGPSFLWRDDAGLCVLSSNGTGDCWETRAGDVGTGNALGQAQMREGRGGYEVVSSYAELGLSKTFVLRPDVIDVQIGTRNASGVVSERVPLLLRSTDTIHVDYGKCPASGTSNRVLGLVTKSLAIERAGRTILRFDMGAPVEASVKCSADRDGIIPALFTFKLAPIYFSRSGYKVYLDA